MEGPCSVLNSGSMLLQSASWPTNSAPEPSPSLQSGIIVGLAVLEHIACRVRDDYC